MRQGSELDRSFGPPKADDEGKDAKPGVNAGLKELDHAWSRLDKMIISY
jgi:hypothetical protein